MSKAKCTKLGKQWQVVLSELVQEAERLVQSSQRQRKLSVEQLVQSLVLGCLEKGKVSLSTWVDVAYDLGCEITKSSLDERLTGRLAMLLYEVLQQSIARGIEVASLPATKLDAFERVILYDSTYIALSPIFKDLFAGSRKGHSSIKIQLGYEYKTAQFSHLALSSGNSPDQTDAGILCQAETNTLICCDLGYFKQERLQQMDERGAYFILPLHSQVALYDGQADVRVDLASHLLSSRVDYFEAHFAVGGKVRHPLRVVAFRLPEQVASSKRRALKKRAKKAGYTPSQQSLILCAWHVLIANLSADWTADDIRLLFGIRWQIELIFKSWKSYLNIETGDYWRRERVFCQLLVTLIGAVLSQQSFALLRWLNSLETSLFRTIDRLRRHLQDLYRVIRHDWYGLDAWATRLRKALLKLARQQTLETAPSTLYRLIHKGLT